MDFVYHQLGKSLLWNYQLVWQIRIYTLYNADFELNFTLNMLYIEYYDLFCC